MPKRYGFISQIALLFLITLLARPAGAQDSKTHFTLSAQETSREGYFVVELDQVPQPGMIVQQSTVRDFSEISTEFAWFGDFEKMTLTGFSDGDYYFRLKPSAEISSNVISVKVKHYPRWQAYSLFFTGLALFTLLVVMIVTLHRRHRHDSTAKVKHD
ncbi:hypothetical protein ACFOD1_09135 [Pseudidiomarina halophila]|uniref:Uncharacterized protein n=1 Tax=Pseudidiomarina halophila TaxID=1449799 RepID=A0A432Y1C5_9GAMM|nr:hypothetical protein [Pseudidiomarina halophila]RUO54741.1 hypothetical protein CWI69_04865 [Pseudidiomarina halophila]